MEKVIAIIGPTAVGKTELSLELAEGFGAPVAERARADVGEGSV